MGIKYYAGYNYQLAETYSVQTRVRPRQAIHTRFTQLDEDGMLTIAGGYAWDGPSGPTMDTKSAMRGSLVHDAFYQMLRLGLLSQTWRHIADEEYQRMCIEDGMFKLRARWHMKALKWFGGPAARTVPEPPPLTAP